MESAWRQYMFSLAKVANSQHVQGLVFCRPEDGSCLNRSLNGSSAPMLWRRHQSICDATSMAKPVSRAAMVNNAESLLGSSVPLPVPGRPTTGLGADGETSLMVVGVVAPMMGGPASVSSAGVAVGDGPSMGPTMMAVGAGVAVNVAVGSGVAVGGGSGVDVAVFGGTGVSVAVMFCVGETVTVAPGTGVFVTVVSGSGVAVTVASGAGVSVIVASGSGVYVAVVVAGGVCGSGVPESDGTSVGSGVAVGVPPLPGVVAVGVMVAAGVPESSPPGVGVLVVGGVVDVGV